MHSLRKFSRQAYSNFWFPILAPSNQRSDILTKYLHGSGLVFFGEAQSLLTLYRNPFLVFARAEDSTASPSLADE